jgi:hypothetical protein
MPDWICEMQGYKITDEKAGSDGRMQETICFCFGYTVEDVRRDFLENGRSTIMERIQNEKKAGTCDCAAKNPKAL